MYKLYFAPFQTNFNIFDLKWTSGIILNGLIFLRLFYDLAHKLLQIIF